MKSGTESLLKKASMSLEAARRDLAAEDPDNAIARAYYAVFHAATASLHETDLTAKTHSGTHDLFYRHFVETGSADREISRALVTLYQDRQQADYAFGATFGQEAAQDAVDRAADFVEMITYLLQ